MGADLSDIQLISKFNKGFSFLLCVIDIYSKYALVVLLKDKKGIAIDNAFPKKLYEWNRKPKKIWVDKGSDFYKRSMKPLLQNNDIEIYLAHNISFITERLIRTLKNKINTWLQFQKIGILINKYSNKRHTIIKMKPIDVKSSTYIDSSKEIM